MEQSLRLRPEAIHFSMSTLTPTSFEFLLNRLDADPAAAASKYETLRMKIVHLVRWRGCPESHADDLADLTLDRVAQKLAAGEQVDNLNSFAAGVARFVLLEHSRKNKLDAVGDDLPEVAIGPDIDSFDDPEPRLRCLRRCVTNFSDEDKVLVVGYYDTDAGEKMKNARKRLAEQVGLTMNAMKVRACRLRMRLESCINDCVARVTDSAVSDTRKQEVI